MAMFTPKNQLRNMLQNQAAQTVIDSRDPLTRIAALNTLIQTQGGNLADSLFDDNWLDDDNLFD